MDQIGIPESKLTALFPLKASFVLPRSFFFEGFYTFDDLQLCTT